METERKQYLDYLRIFALLAVILMHSSSRVCTGLEPNNIQWMICNAIGSLTRWAVPVFVMISGALMLSKEDLSTKRLFRKNIWRLTTSYFFWSFIYTFVFSTIPYYHVFSISGIINTISGTLMGGYYHLWFIPMIISLYLMVPILRKFIEQKDKDNIHYLFGLGLVICFIFPLLKSNTRIESLIGTTLDSLSQSYWGVYAFYFLLGYYLDTIKLTHKQIILCYWFGGFAAIFTVLSVLIPAHFANTDYTFFLMSDSLNILCICIALFVAVKHHFGGKNHPPKKLIIEISKYTFGAYLVHELVMRTCQEVVMQILPPVAAMPVLFVTVAGISFAVIFILGKIKYLSKYIL